MMAAIAMALPRYEPNASLPTRIQVPLGNECYLRTCHGLKLIMKCRKGINYSVTVIQNN